MTLEELASSILQDGLIEPILVRPKGKRYELIAGERRFRAIRDYTNMQTIEARVVIVDDIGARRISAAENLQREDLAVFETIETIVEIVDAELIEDKEYVSMGHRSADRLNALLARFDAVRRSEQRGYKIADSAQMTSHRFMGRVQEIFKNLPKPVKWRSFYTNDLPLLLSTCKEVQDASIRHNLNKSRTRALSKLKKISESEFKRIAESEPSAGKTESSPDQQHSGDRDLGDYSSVEIEAIADRELKKQAIAEQGRSRESAPLNSKVKVLLMNRLGISPAIIARTLNISRKTVTRYVKDARLLQAVRESLADGLSVPETAKEHGLPEPLVWSVRLEGKSDQERFKALNWGLRPWDYLYFNDVDHRFGDNWPGRIPAQLAAHVLFNFSSEGQRVLDVMAGGGVMADTCLAFRRECRSFDLVDRSETRPEIETFYWDPESLSWPIEGKETPDLIFFDPPYFRKKEAQYETGSISGLDTAGYLTFFREIFSLFRENTNPGARMVMLNGDWRDFQGVSAMDEDPRRGIVLYDYIDLFSKSGWQVTHVIDSPLSTQRFHPNMVSKMQQRRSIGTVKRYLVVGTHS